MFINSYRYIQAVLLMKGKDYSSSHLNLGCPVATLVNQTDRKCCYTLLARLCKDFQLSSACFGMLTMMGVCSLQSLPA